MNNKERILIYKIANVARDSTVLYPFNPCDIARVSHSARCYSTLLKMVSRALEELASNDTSAPDTVVEVESMLRSYLQEREKLRERNAPEEARKS
ncbi:hypothetical protein Ga0100231_023990 [Opitutaceae bacterium TAV4]|nr:hypothetical protein Ga0100231_023990 [Opitutaceae bacterium TAV4]RRK00773.1 hypothetical protein Ga0100230_023565 [Opitutaceae bacterium TAV3]